MNRLPSPLLPSLFLLALTLGLAGGACREESDAKDAGPAMPALCPSEDGVDEECDPYDEVHLPGTWARDVCRFLYHCCSDVDRVYVLETLVGEQALQALSLVEPELLVDEDACLRGLAVALAQRLQDDFIAYLDDRRRYDRDAAEACYGFADLAAERCAPGLLLIPPEAQPEACSRVFPPAIERGGTCYADDDCKRGAPPDGAVDGGTGDDSARDGGVADGESGSPSICISHTGPTPDGGVRVSLTGRCEAVPGLFEPCSLVDGRCQEGLFCAIPNAVCAPKAEPDAACVGAPCVDTAYCDEATLRCAAKRPAGTPCTADVQCADGDCSPEIHVCLPTVAVDPTRVEYDFCLGDES